MFTSDWFSGLWSGTNEEVEQMQKQQMVRFRECEVVYRKVRIWMLCIQPKDWSFDLHFMIYMHTIRCHIEKMIKNKFRIVCGNHNLSWNCTMIRFPLSVSSCHRAVVWLITVVSLHMQRKYTQQQTLSRHMSKTNCLHTTCTDRRHHNAMTINARKSRDVVLLLQSNIVRNRFVAKSQCGGDRTCAFMSVSVERALADSVYGMYGTCMYDDGVQSIFMIFSASARVHLHARHTTMICTYYI